MRSSSARIRCRRLVAATAWLAAAVGVLGAGDAGGQPDRDAVLPLPPVDGGVFDGLRFAALGDPQDLTEPLLLDGVAPPGQPPQEFAPPAGRRLPPGAKPGPLQQAIVTTTVLPNLGAGGLGLTTVDSSLTIGLPAPTIESPLLLTPGFGVSFVDEAGGPGGPGLPPQLFDAWLQARWLTKVGRRLGVDLAVAPGWYSDFVNDTSEALRITGHGFGAWEAGDTLRVVVGVIYLDRYDVNLLPAGGLLWTPTDDRRFELLFPRPRLAWRVAESSGANPGGRSRAAQWVYLAGEFGGNQWAVRRDPQAGGVDDVMTYLDYRLLAGWERKPADLGASWRVEGGWVTGRLVRYYVAAPGDFRPSDTFLVRAGLWY
jgi:hypothetical protein